MRTYCLVVLLLSMSLASFEQTTILITKKKRKVYVAADSKVSLYSDTSFSGQFCKIYCKNGKGVVIQGFATTAAKRAAIDILSKNLSLDSSAELFIHSFPLTMLSMLDTLYKYNPEHFFSVKEQQGKTIFSSATFFGIEDDTAKIVVGYTFLIDTTVITLQSNKVHRISFGAGWTDSCDQRFVKNELLGKPRAIIPLMIAGINREIASHGRWVGRPVVALILSKRRMRWFPKDSNCSN